MKGKLFDFAIGNPPYQKEFSTNGNKTYATPVYNKFMDATNEVATGVELIHPARFLFNAGSTPKVWNSKMLNSPHFAVLKYEENASMMFPSTEIKGGVAITYHNGDKDFEPIVVFTKYDILNGILHKVSKPANFCGMDSITISRTAYRLTDKLHKDYPDIHYHEDNEGNNIGVLSKGHDYDMSTNIFELLPQIFFDNRPNDEEEYVRIYGRYKGKRVLKWIKREYVNNPKPFFNYSVILPKANNTGHFGEVLSQPMLTEPGVGSTETFLSVGYFDTQEAGENCLKYIFTKFARTMLGILKTTQDITPAKWKFVPLQDFTSSSDIDWSKSIHEIDKQLYKKYGLRDEEINFIETNVKEMA